MKVLVLGGNGQLGQDLSRAGESLPHDVRVIGEDDGHPRANVGPATAL